MYRRAALAAAAVADPAASATWAAAARREPALSHFNFQQPPDGYFPALFSEVSDLSPPEARGQEAGVRWLARGACVDFARGFFTTDENGAEEPAAQRARRFGAYDLERACLACGVLPPAEGVEEEKQARQQVAKMAAAAQEASARPAAQVVAVKAVPIAGKHPGWRDVLVSETEFVQCARRRVAVMRPVCGGDGARARLLAGSLQTAAEEEAHALETDVLRLQEISRIRRGAGGVRELDAATRLDAHHPHLRDSAGSAASEAGHAAGAPPEGLGERQLSFLARRVRRGSVPDSAQDEDIVQKSTVSKRPFGQRVAEARPIHHAERSSADKTAQRVRDERDGAPVAFPIADLPKAEEAEPASKEDEEQTSAGPMPAGDAPPAPSPQGVLPEFSTAPADVSVVFTGECLEEPLVSFHLYAAVRDRILELRVEEERVREELMRSESERVELS